MSVTPASMRSAIRSVATVWTHHGVIRSVRWSSIHTMVMRRARERGETAGAAVRRF